MQRNRVLMLRVSGRSVRYFVGVVGLCLNHTIKTSTCLYPFRIRE